MECYELVERMLLVQEAEMICTNSVRQLTINRSYDVDVVNRSCSFPLSAKYLYLCRVLQKIYFVNHTYFIRRHRSALRLYVLSEIHRLLVMNDTCTVRELFYKRVALCCTQRAVKYVLRDVCSVLHTMPSHVGIYSSGKGLVAGPIKLITQNGDIVDCNTLNGITLAPKIVNSIVLLQTNALFVLIVEKDTVFQLLLTHIIALGNYFKLILVTGRGYPDACTRNFIQRIFKDCRLPIFILVDSDPFGIEIMCSYKTCSATIELDYLESQYSWIGVHPSELITLDIRTVPFTTHDSEKMLQLLMRGNISYNIRTEMYILDRLKRKAQVEDLSPEYLLREYILNKINRQLVF